MATDSQPKQFTQVPNPFCGIGSDDLTVEVAGVHVHIRENGDQAATLGFETPIIDTEPRIGGQSVPIKRAIEDAAELLRKAQLPVFSGFGTDVRDTRAALSLIDRCRGIFDQMRAEGGLRNLLVLSDSGWVATTLGELKNRMDVLVIFGSDIESHFPRFFERLVWVDHALFCENTSQREIIIIGPSPSGSATSSPNGQAAQIIPCDQKDLPEVAATLSALAQGVEIRADKVRGVSLSMLRDVVSRLEKSRYGVVTWVAGQLCFPHAELTVQQLCRMVSVLNKKTRCAILPLGGQEGDRTASQVASWISGYPTRVSYARGYPEYDPYHNGTERLLASGEADLLVWVSSLSLTPPPVTSVPTIVIGRSGMVFEKEPDIFIPVGVPGVDFAGHSYRCDSVVAFPLYSLRDSPLPRAATILQAIEEEL